MVQERYINPLTDYGFKKLFGSEPNKDLLIDFLNQVIPNHTVVDLTYAQNEHLGNNSLDRNVVFDIYCIGDKDERFIVEMQKAKQDFFKDRSIFYSSFPIQEQGKKSDWNYKLEPIFTIGILDFIFEEHRSEEKLYHIVSLKDQDCEEFYKKLKFIYIELPKFNKTEDELETSFDKWLFVLKHLQDLSSRPQALQERIFKRVFKIAEIAKYTPEERKKYEDSLKVYRDIKNALDTAFDEGKEEGEQIGLEKGEQIGALKEKYETAHKMKKKGMDVSLIAELTGLSIEQIQKLE